MSVQQARGTERSGNRRTIFTNGQRPTNVLPRPPPPLLVRLRVIQNPPRHRVIKTGITRYLTQTTHRYLVFSRYLSNRVVLQVPFTALGHAACFSAGTVRAVFRPAATHHTHKLHSLPPLDEANVSSTIYPRLTPMLTHKVHTLQTRFVAVGRPKADDAAWTAPPKSWMGGRPSPFFFSLAC